MGTEDGAALYDAIVLRDVLHLIDDPLDLLASLRGLLRPGGQMVCRIPNLHTRGIILRRLTKRNFPLRWSKTQIGCEPYDFRQFKGLLKASGLEHCSGGYASPADETGTSYRGGLAARFKLPFIYASGYAVDHHAS